MKTFFYLWLIFTLLLTSIPQSKIPSSTTFFSYLCHLFFYSTLALFNLAGFKSKKYQMFIVLGIIALIDELHQSFIPGRSPSYIDFVLDLMGGGIVCLSL